MSWGRVLESVLGLRHVLKTILGQILVKTILGQILVKSCSRPCLNLGYVAKFVLTLGHLLMCLKMVLTPKL